MNGVGDLLDQLFAQLDAANRRNALLERRVAELEAAAAAEPEQESPEP